MWGVIASLVADGTTLLLTTQYLEEADVLADDIVVIDHGRAIARGTSDQLKAQIGGERLELTVRDADRLDEAVAASSTSPRRRPRVTDEHPVPDVPVTGGVGALRQALGQLEGASALEDAGVRRPTLDDVFLTLTGSERGDDGTARGRAGRGSGVSTVTT